ncbi:MAG TPA: ATP:cob(I)alamin adenosyltransferase [Planctomycetaceae bacterium]|nr:ATP:cob(I)alamin adenosyltransferase [Planctomycetaceae bacterium]
MPDRINRVTTRTGDDGQTSLADGKRYPKGH